MIKFAELGLKPEFQSYFDDFCCLMNCFPGGRKYLLGDESGGHLKVSFELEKHLDRDPFYQGNSLFQERKKINEVLNALKFHYYRSGHFKTDPLLRFYVGQEPNLLGALLDDSLGRSYLCEALKIALLTNAKALTNQKKIGLLALLLVFECGQMRDQDVFSIVKELCLRKPIHNVESLYFIDYPKFDDQTKTHYTGRVILSPLTLQLLCDNDFISYLVGIPSITQRRVVKERIELIRSQLKPHEAKFYTEKMLKRDIQFFALDVLPGFLAKVSGTKLRTYCLPLADFGRLHGLYIEPEIEDIPEEQEVYEDDDDDEDEEASSGRRVNVRYFSESDLNRLIYFISIHPTVSKADYARFRLLLNMCFYQGFRRSEALFIRQCDVFAAETQLIPSSVFVRVTDQRGLKTLNSKRHQPIDLLPPDVANFIKDKADFSSEGLLFDRDFNKMSAQHFFDRLSRLMTQILGRGYVLHTCRHSYLSSGILLSMADQVSMTSIASASSYLRETVARSQRFRHSFRMSKISGQHLTNLSQSAGHSKVETTLANYLHSTEFVTWAAMCAHRPEGYLKALPASIDVSLRTLQRWNASNRFIEEVMNHVAKKCDIIKRYDTPITEIDQQVEESFLHYKNHYQEELSGRELWEWVRLHKVFATPKADDIVNRLKGHLNERGQLVINSKDELRAFKSSCTKAGIDKSFWEARVWGAADKCFYPFSSLPVRSSFPIFVRVDYAQNKLNVPRRMLKLLIETF